MSNEKCVICGESLPAQQVKRWFFDIYHFYACPVCGEFVTDDLWPNEFGKDVLRIFLFYNNHNWSEQRGWYFIGDPLAFDKLQKCYQQQYHIMVRLLTEEVIEGWYPKNFNEKINSILLKMAQLSKYEGHRVPLSYKQFESLFFVKVASEDSTQKQEKSIRQLSFFEDYMRTQELMSAASFNKVAVILPDGWKRIDELQKNQVGNKKAFIAMTFGRDADTVYKAICEGITKAGYTPERMDKVEHNNQAVPELLSRIRQSRFVVVELTSHNNGAYYESGYAEGLGKQVIHICKKNAFKRKGHFDVKQKLTIFWENNPEEIVEKLRERIEATI
jgi:hypothetical protein